MIFQDYVFYALAAILLLAGLRVITTRNPVHAALYLVLAFFTAAGIWLLLQAEFLAMGVAAQCMQTAEARAGRRALLGVLDRHLAREEIATGQGHAFDQFHQHQAGQQFFDFAYHSIVSAKHSHDAPNHERNVLHTCLSGTSEPAGFASSRQRR